MVSSTRDTQETIQRFNFFFYNFFLNDCLLVSLTPLQVYLLQRVVAFYHVHEGEERDPLHISSCSEFSLSYSFYRPLFFMRARCLLI